MSNYSYPVNSNGTFGSRDALGTGNPAKTIKGSEFDDEFNAIVTAIASKEDAANKDQASGYAGLNSSSQIVNAQINWASPSAIGGTAPAAGAFTTLTATSLALSGAITGATIAASLITSGTLADARVAASNVTQHEAALSIASSQITGTFSLDTSEITSGTFADARIAASNVTQHQAALSIAASQLTGTLADARVAQSNVTQHQAALSIDHGQLVENDFSISAATMNSTGLTASGPTVTLEPGTYIIDVYHHKLAGVSSGTYYMTLDGGTATIAGMYGALEIGANDSGTDKRSFTVLSNAAATEVGLTTAVDAGMMIKLSYYVTVSVTGTIRQRFRKSAGGDTNITFDTSIMEARRVS